MTIFFYKVSEPYGCFSNFSPHPIQIAGTDWSTVEHYYQAQKFVGSRDASVIPLIQAATTPEEAAALGRCDLRDVRSDWQQVKIPVMRAAVLTKFLTHGEIRAVLLLTGNEILVENSPTDYFWGCGANKSGENHLGKVLMTVREQLSHLPTPN
jgi:ribA/ribD-fused uncharacterized protein